jgi:phosphoglucomutase
VTSYDLMVIKVIDAVGHYLEFLSQLFGDLDEIRTAELRLLELA